MMMLGQYISKLRQYHMLHYPSPILKWTPDTTKEPQRQTQHKYLVYHQTLVLMGESNRWPLWLNQCINRCTKRVEKYVIIIYLVISSWELCLHIFFHLSLFCYVNFLITGLMTQLLVGVTLPDTTYITQVLKIRNTELDLLNVDWTYIIIKFQYANV